MEEARRRLGDSVSYAADNYEALRGADALIVATEWSDFREPDFEKMKGLMRSPLVFDGRNIYKPDKMRRLGFEYVSIGRP